MMKTLKIDRDGLVLFENQTIEDKELAKEFLDQLFYDDQGLLRTFWDKEVLAVQVFDQPLLATEIVASKDESPWKLKGRYGFEVPFHFQELKVDDWDRFLGRTLSGIPFVMSPKAQNQFFELVDSFDDDGFCLNGIRYEMPYWLNTSHQNLENRFWANHYEEQKWPWDLDGPHPALEPTLAQLKLNKLRVLVLGCGRGHDAAYLSSKGHIVTAVDFEPQAIEEAKRLYPKASVHWVVKDLFSISVDWFDRFDLIFEHTCYCAIDPQRRGDLVKLWSKLLITRGHLLGVFFAMDKETGPPFGGSEWEIYKRIKPFFEPRYWTRWEHSLGRRQEKELVVFAEKK